MFYDIHIHDKRTDGEDDIDSIIEIAKKLNITGLGIVAHQNELEWDERDDIDIVKAVLIKPKNVSDMKDIVKGVREKAEVVIVAGGDYEINRSAVENPFVDILAYPEFNRKDSGMDHVCMRAAHENNVAIEINFREVLETGGRHRALILAAMRKNIMLAKKYDVKIVTTSGAFSKWNMRSPRDMVALTHILGLDISDAIATVSDIPKEIVEDNRKRLSGKKWNGVEIVE